MIGLDMLHKYQHLSRMIPWCMRAANSAGATATGQIASTRKLGFRRKKLQVKYKISKPVPTYKKNTPVTQIGKALSSRESNRKNLNYFNE